MSRSRRKSPFRGLGSDSDRPFKVVEHRRERRAVKISLGQGDEPPHPKTYGDPWSSCKDGKCWLDPANPKDMRK